MSQRTVERLLGRLLTDEDLRTEFVRDPGRTLDTLRQEGWELSTAEVDALMSGPPAMWREIASRIPTRLKRCSLRTE
jgi:hypothetical protein